MNAEILLKQVRLAIQKMKLDLHGLTVLTEAASGPFVVTPLIAAFAGAKRVIAITRNSSWGKASDIQNQTEQLAAAWGCSGRITVQQDLSAEELSTVDMVTNLGFLRPISERIIKALPTHAAIALMWEPWEFRASDVDLPACVRYQIPIIATNEHHPDVKTFEYVGVLALKLLLEAQCEVLGSSILVIGSNPFGEACVKTLEANEATVFHVNPIESWPPHLSPETFSAVEAVVVVEHQFSGQIIGQDSGWRLPEGVPIIHICGTVDETYLELNHHVKTPQRKAPFGVMTVTTAYVGSKPVVDLHCAGLKAVSVVARARKEGATIPQAIHLAVETGYALPLPPFLEK